VLELQRGTSTAFTSDVFSIWPTWSPDDKQVLFSSMRDGEMAPYRQAVAAGEDARKLFDTTKSTTATDWLADDRILYQSGNFPRADIGLFTISTTQADSAFLHTSAGVSEGRVSPDGRWMAYVSEGEIFVTSFPDRVDKIHVSTGGGEQPRWGRNETELYYLASKKVMAVAFHGAPNAGHATPVALFDAIADHYAVTKDGQRFLLVIPTGDTPASQPFTVIVNWIAALGK
jgi:Tol biopolymer transport system component